MMRKMIRPSKQGNKGKVHSARRTKRQGSTDQYIKKFLSIPPKPKSFMNNNANIVLSNYSSFNAQPIEQISNQNENVIVNRVKYIYSKRNLETSKLIEKTITFERCKLSEYSSLFTNKCRVCCGFCNFVDEYHDMTLKKIKLDTLHELYFAITTPEIAKHLTATCSNALFHMICVNIFRKIPFVERNALIENVYDKEWIHLAEVYKIFEFILNSKLINISNIQIKTYLKQLFRIVLSPDPREQSCACNCLAAFLKSYPESKQFIITKTNTILMWGREDKTVQHALFYFLQFFERNLTILRPSNLTCYFKHNILPLSLSSNFPLYSTSYLELVKSFLKRDPSLVNDYINYLVLHWPIANFKKQSNFLNAFQSITQDFSSNIVHKVAVKLFKVISQCFSNYTMDISQEALCMIQEPYMISLLSNKANDMIQSILNTLNDTSIHHWSEVTRLFAKGAYDAVGKLVEQKSKDNSKQKHTEKEKDIQKDDKSRSDIWNIIRNMAKDPPTVTKENNHTLANLINPNYLVKPPTHPCNRAFRNFRKRPGIAM